MVLKCYISSFLLLAVFFGPIHMSGQVITTVAGHGTSNPGDGGQATASLLYEPISVALDAAGNYYFTDFGINRIRKVDTAGIITTIAGKGYSGYSGDNGPATNAVISGPYGLAIDKAGNIYFSDDGNNRIRKINTAGIITTIAGTGVSGYSGDNAAATGAMLSGPGGLAVDSVGNIFFADFFNDRVRKIDTAGIITTVAGTGTSGYNGDEIPATTAQLRMPTYVCLDRAHNIYICDYDNARVRKVDAAGVIHTVAGVGIIGYSGDNGPATLAKLKTPQGVYADNNGNLYIGDALNAVVRKVNTAGIITTIAGSGTTGCNGDGGDPLLADLSVPIGVAIDSAGRIYIADYECGTVRRIQKTTSAENITGTNKTIAVFPNPFTDRLNVTVSSIIDEPVNITVSDITGRRVSYISAFTNQEISVQVAGTIGVYVLRAVTASGVVEEKVVKED